LDENYNFQDAAARKTGAICCCPTLATPIAKEVKPKILTAGKTLGAKFLLCELQI
jgi:hypothetical protein